MEEEEGQEGEWKKEEFKRKKRKEEERREREEEERDFESSPRVQVLEGKGQIPTRDREEKKKPKKAAEQEGDR